MATDTADSAAVGQLIHWPDLSAYHIDLKLVAGDAIKSRPHRLLARGATEAYAEELSALGFERRGGEWSRGTGGIGVRDLADSVRKEFPELRLTAVTRSAVVCADTDPLQVSYTTVGAHGGKPRLWLEGLRLGQAGFNRGERYTVVMDPVRRSITLTHDAAGDRSVSGRTRAGRTPTPIIDVASGDLNAIMSEGMRLQAVIRPGQIQFTLAPKEAAKHDREARLRQHVSVGLLTEGTLCAGAGVATQAVAEGFHNAGLRSSVEWIVDRERRYLEVAAENNRVVTGATRLFEASLEELAPSLLPQVDVVQVSLPCTGHSVSGKAKRGLAVAEEHPTDALAIYGALRLIEAVQPSVIISENVPLAASSASYAIFRAYLTEAGYKVFDKVMDETDAGSIEARSRWWFVAVSEGLAKGFDLENMPVIAKRFSTLGEVLEAIDDDDPAWARNEYLQKKAARDLADGKGFRRQWVGPDSTTVGTIGRGYQKRRSTEPFVVRDDGMERLLTPAEHARVKGVPEELVRGVGVGLAHELLGQSILFGHGVLLGQRVAAHCQQIVAPNKTAQHKTAKPEGPKR